MKIKDFFWWRWRESNSRPIIFPHKLLRVQFVIKFPTNLFNKQNLFAVFFFNPTNTKDKYQFRFLQIWRLSFSRRSLKVDDTALRQRMLILYYQRLFLLCLFKWPGISTTRYLCFYITVETKYTPIFYYNKLHFKSQIYLWTYEFDLCSTLFWLYRIVHDWYNYVCI